MRITLNLDLRGDLAEAFLEEWKKRLDQNPKLAKTELARDLVRERLEAFGHKADDPIIWGGYRERSDEGSGESQESPEVVGVAAEV